MNSKRNNPHTAHHALDAGSYKIPRQARNVIILMIIILCAGFSVDKKLDNAQQEKQAQKLFQDIKCLVCKGESLAESNADMAVDMREMIRNKIAQGQAPTEIKADLVEKFGEQILQTPPIDNSTYLLWFFPAILLIFGGLLIFKRSIKS